MLDGEITKLCSDIHTKDINVICGQNIEFFNIEPSVTLGLKSLNKCIFS